MFGYSPAAFDATQGRATYSMEFKHYSGAPKNVRSRYQGKKLVNLQTQPIVVAVLN